MLDFDGAKWNAPLPEKRNDLRKMAACANQDSNTIFIAAVAGVPDVGKMLFDDAQNNLGLLALSRTEIGQRWAAIGAADDLRVNVYRALRWIQSSEGRRACERNRRRTGRRVLRANQIEDAVERASEPGVRAEIDGKLHRVAAEPTGLGADAVFAHLREQLDLGLAKHVDGLHRIADQKDGAALARIPRGQQRGDEFVLPARSVLELVDEQMANVAGDIQHPLR